MNKTIVKDIYTVWSLEIPKASFAPGDMNGAVEFLKKKIEEHPVAILLSLFDHYNHTAGLKEGSINPDIKDVKVVIFCFGKKIESPAQVSLRPRSIILTETDETFTISFQDPPNEDAKNTMTNWAEAMSK